MDSAGGVKAGILWRAEWDPPRAGPDVRATCRLRRVFAAFANEGVVAQPVVYTDDGVDQVRGQLLGLDGVLVWVNPIEQGLDRTMLDRLLCDVANAGVWVSAHPDVITRMATKRVLYDTRELSWGTDTYLYGSTRELLDVLPSRLADGVPRVLKQARGMGGQGVWKVELEAAGDEPSLCVQEAVRDATVARVSLADFARRCEPYFADAGFMVDQPFQERIAEGMIRVYLTHDAVVGFAYQYPAGLRPEGAREPPAGKQFEPPDADRFQRLRRLVEAMWVPELMRLLGLERNVLPVIWDADFFHSSEGEGYVLCEINASSTFAFPEFAMPSVAKAALARIAATRRPRP